MAVSERADYSEIVERLLDLGLCDDPAFEAEILGDFLCDAELVVAALGAAVRQKDAAECERLAHRLRGASQNLGAAALAKPALELEQAGREKDLTNAPHAQERLVAEFESLREFLRRRIRSIQKPS
jgi:HPt (histidine-containing phosphotransfer) domain-containing protein